MTERHVYITKSDDGRWQVYGDDGRNLYTAELVNTYLQANGLVSRYAKSIGWQRGSYVLSVDR